MAEEIVSSLLLKLADAIYKEAISLYGAKEKMKSVERELRWIQSFLKDADSRRKGDNRVQMWVKDVREVSFLIEDALDTFLIKVESLRLKEPGFCNTLKRVVKKPMKLVATHNLDSAIKEIQSRLKEIKENQERYNIKDLEDSSLATAMLSDKPPVIPEIDEIDLVGFDAEKNEIVGLLLDENNSRRVVVSIVGIGGLGKTTLAEKVYQSVENKRHFDFHVWLTVSKEFKPIVLLKKMLEKAKGSKFEKEYDEEYYITEVNKFLTEKRYFIVLDDIWSENVWTRIKRTLPNHNKGSRVLITTRFFEIAKAADPESDPCELRYLSEEESLKLLFKMALPGKKFNEGYPHDLLEVAKRFSKQCGGLPLALVVVGGLLSTKAQTGSAWDKVFQTMDWQTNGNKCTEILASSYEDLPVHLKTCFIYLASFPDDTDYEARLVIRLWIAEGFIPHDAPGTMEEIAEKYLEELAQRCMIQVTERDSSSIDEFRVHDLLLDLAIHEAKEKDFLHVFSKQNYCRGSNVVARRATLQLQDYSWDDLKKQPISIPNVRSLIFFEKVPPFNSQFKLLRVLLIYKYKCPDGEENPHWLNNLNRLLHLRCLICRGCRFGRFVLAIDHLHNLQTLEIDDCTGLIVPKNIVVKDYDYIFGIKSLKHVRCPIEIAVQGESASAYVPNRPTSILEEIYEIREKPCFILTIKDESWESIFTGLNKLQQNYPDITIVSLRLSGRVIPLSKIKDILSSQYLELVGLYLNGEIQPESVVWIPDDISKLVLSQSNIDHDTMQVLMYHLFSLDALVLHKGAYIGKQIKFPDGCLECLEYLEISLLAELEEWHIEEGAMPHLTHMVIHKCPKLRMLPELQHLKELEILELIGMPKIFIQRMLNEDQHKINHIPYVVQN